MGKLGSITHPLIQHKLSIRPTDTSTEGLWIGRWNCCVDGLWSVAWLPLEDVEIETLLLKRFKNNSRKKLAIVPILLACRDWDGWCPWVWYQRWVGHIGMYQMMKPWNQLNTWWKVRRYWSTSEPSRPDACYGWSAILAVDSLKCGASHIKFVRLYQRWRRKLFKKLPSVDIFTAALDDHLKFEHGYIVPGLEMQVTTYSVPNKNHSWFVRKLLKIWPFDHWFIIAHILSLNSRIASNDTKGEE